MQTHKILMNVAVAVLFAVSAENMIQAQTEPVSATTETTPSTTDTKCPYTVTPSDNVYFQVESVTLKSNNLPIDPYFCLYQYKDGKDVKYCGTWSHEGKQICEKVEDPSHFELYFDSRQKEYRLDVLSDWGNQTIAKGTKFSIEPLIKWADDPQNKDKTYSLEVSQGNTVNLQFIRSKKTYYYFQIVSYRIETIDPTYGKYNMPYGQYILENYKPTIAIQMENVPEKQVNSFSVNPKALENKDSLCAEFNFDSPEKQKESDFLLSCKADKKVTFSIKNKLGELDRFELSANSVIEQMTKCMTENPTDNSKWFVKCTSKQQSEIVLKFAGIRRIYRINSITIPPRHPVQEKGRYAEKGYAPWLRIYVKRNGKRCGLNCKYATPGHRSWESGVPNDKYNRFEIREGIGDTYSLHIKDADTMFYEIHLLDIPNITDSDFTQKFIREKVDMYSLDKATIVEFEEVK